MAEQQLGLFGAAAPEDIRKRIGRINEADISLAQLSPIRAPIAMASQTARDIGTVASESLFGTPEGRKYKAIKSVLDNTQLKSEDPQAYFEQLAISFKDAGLHEQALMALNQSYAMQSQGVTEDIEFGKINAKMQDNLIKAREAKTAEERNRLTEENYKSLAEYRKGLLAASKKVAEGKMGRDALYRKTAGYVQSYEKTLLTKFGVTSVEELPEAEQRTLISLSKPQNLDFLTNILTGGISQDFLGGYGFSGEGTPEGLSQEELDSLPPELRAALK